MPDFEEVNDRAVWWDVHLDAAAWYRTETVTPMQAALLMAGHNPNRKWALEAAQLDTGAGIGPDDFQRLLSVLEGAAPSRPRSLSGWIAYARERGLLMHPWVTEFNETFVNAFVTPSVAGISNNSKKPQKKHREWSHNELRELLCLNINQRMTHQKLAELYGLSRQQIGKLLNRANVLELPQPAVWIDPLKESKKKK